MTVCEIFFKLKFSKFIQDIRTLESFGKFLLIVWLKCIFTIQKNLRVISQTKIPQKFDPHILIRILKLCLKFSETRIYHKKPKMETRRGYDYMNSKSWYRSHTERHFYGTENVIWAGFGPVSNTEKKEWATFEGIFFMFSWAKKQLFFEFFLISFLA